MAALSSEFYLKDSRTAIAEVEHPTESGDTCCQNNMVKAPQSTSPQSARSVTEAADPTHKLHKPGANFGQSALPPNVEDRISRFSKRSAPSQSPINGQISQGSQYNFSAQTVHLDAATSSPREFGQKVALLDTTRSRHAAVGEAAAPSQIGRRGSRNIRKDVGTPSYRRTEPPEEILKPSYHTQQAQTAPDSRLWTTINPGTKRGPPHDPDARAEAFGPLVRLPKRPKLAGLGSKTARKRTNNHLSTSSAVLSSVEHKNPQTSDSNCDPHQIPSTPVSWSFTVPTNERPRVDNSPPESQRAAAREAGPSPKRGGHAGGRGRRPRKSLSDLAAPELEKLERMGSQAVNGYHQAQLATTPDNMLSHKQAMRRAAAAAQQE